ncbi:MAG: TIGR03943 family protein [Chloroflexi bacterium]|nr:TIGR03943 family protein [Chloroflexota bacterium]
MQTNLLISTSTPAPNRGAVAIKAALLFGLAAYFAYNILSGNLTNYINARFAWLSYVAVVLFAVGGAAALAELRGGVRSGAFSHSRTSLSMMLMLAVPLVLGTLIPSRPLGAEAINGSIRVGAASYSAAEVALVSKAPLDRDILDWSRAFVTEQSPSAFNGQQANVLGFVYTEPGYPENTFMVARFTLSCCVADASALGLPAYYAGADAPEAGAWVEVSGEFQAGEFLGQQVPVLQAAQLTPVEEPEHPYLYP